MDISQLMMDERNGRVRVNMNARQKRKLVQCVTNHPRLIANKFSQDFTLRDSHRLWQSIAVECNAIPGARKTWKQWRKTWQDLRSITKRRQKRKKGLLPSSVTTLTSADQEPIYIDNLSPSTTPTYQENTEFVVLEQNNMEENMDDSKFTIELEAVASMSQPESPPEYKVFTSSEHKSNMQMKNSVKRSSRHSDDCVFNCDVLAIHEERKIQIKEDYLNFKKEYLKQKLKIMNEQKEALKTIAMKL